MLRDSKELQMRSPHGPNAGITQETSKYGTKKLRGQQGCWGWRSPDDVSLPRKAPMETSYLSKGGMEGRRAETGDFV